MPTKPTILVSSAGTGKTTALLAELEKVLKASRPERVMFTTFTNAGASELASRAVTKFPEYKETDFKFFRTLHSIAYRNIPNKQMIRPVDKINFGRICHYPISGGTATSGSDGSYRSNIKEGDILMSMSDLWRTSLCPPSEIVRNQTMSSFSVDELVKFRDLYDRFREKLGKYDFGDQLEVFLRRLTSADVKLPVDHVFVDEAQDLSRLQWKIIDQIANHSKTYVIAGDDKQSIYEFSGANPEHLITLDGNRDVLGTSYRLSQKVLELSQDIAKRITKKQDYTVAHRPDAPEGLVARINGLSECDFTQGSWFILVRNRFMMQWIEEELVKLGVFFTTDNPYSLIDIKIVQAIQTWKEMCSGFPCSGKSLRELSHYLPTKKAIAYGFKKMWENMHDDETLSYEELEQSYGLLTRKEWHTTFNLPENAREALMLIEKRGQLDKEPTVRISTIHGVKGQEADNVVVFPDITKQTEQSLNKNPNSEHRVFYVAVTRAKENLFLHAPLTDMYYPL